MRRRAIPAIRQSILHPLAAALLVALGVVSGASAQEPRPQNESAELLRQAYETYRNVTRGWDDDTWWLQGSPERVDPGTASAAIRDLQPVVRMYRQMLEAGPPEFDIEYDGWTTPAQHLSWQRSVMTAVATDLYWRVHTGDTTHVADDLAGMFEMSGHARDGQFIGSLVETSTFALTTDLVNEKAIPAGMLGPEDAKQILSAVDERLEHDLFGLGAAMSNEGERMTEWMLEMNADDATRAQMLEELSKSAVPRYEGQPGDPELMLELADMSEEEVEAAAIQSQQAWRDMAAATQIDDLELAKAEAERIAEAIAKGEYGPIAQVSGVGGNVPEIMSVVLEDVQELRADLQTIIEDPEGVAKLRNAAIWYRRAFAERHRLDVETWRTIERVAAITDQQEPQGAEDATSEDEPAETPPSTADFEAVRESTSAIVDILLEAATIERCRFQDLDDRRRSGSVPSFDFLDPMRDLATVLRATTNAELALGEQTAAGERLGAAIIMCDHLSQERWIEVSDLAEELFRDATPVLAQFHERVRSNAEAMKTIEDAFSRLDDDDPFGHRRCLESYRAVTTAGLTFQMDRPDAARRRAALARMGRHLGARKQSLYQGDPEALEREALDVPEASFRQATRELDEFVAEAARRYLEAETMTDIDALHAEIDARLSDPERPLHLASWAAMYVAPLPDAARAWLTSKATFAAVRAEARR